MSATVLHSNRYGILTDARLQVFEVQLETILPNDYREFLLRHNGGIPQPACFLAPDDPFEGEASSLSEREVACFFALHDNGWDDNTPEGSLGFPLHEAWRDFSAEPPQGSLIPIGKDWNGSYICIGYIGEKRRQVIFYDHEFDATIRLAQTFTEFLNGLRDCEA